VFGAVRPGLNRMPCGHGRRTLGFMDADGFIRDGYVVVRGAVDAETAAACRELIWESMAKRGVRRDDRGTWPSVVEIDDLGAGPFAAAAGRWRWPPPVTN